MISLSRLNPYVLWIKVGLLALVVTLLFWLGWHEMGIRADLKAKTSEVAIQKATTEMYAKQFQDYINLNKEIADAVKKVRVQSNNYIRNIESSQPVVADGDPVVLVSAGLPSGAGLAALSGFENHSAARGLSDVARSTGGKAGL